MLIRSALTCPIKAFLALVLLFGVQAMAHAKNPHAPPSETGCPVLAELPKGADAESIAAWSAVLGACQRNPVFLAAFGRLLIQAGRYTDAIDHLERALMFEPALMEARVDYAVALAGVGDAASSLAMLDSLLAEADLPHGLRDALQIQMQALAGLSGTGWQRRMSVAARLGYDSNLGGAPSLGSLSLTIGGQPVVLPLDESYQAREGLYARADWQLEMRRLYGDGSRVDILASARLRGSPSVDNVGTHMAEIQTEYRAPASGTGTIFPYMGAAVGLLQAQAGARYLSMGASAGLGRQWQASTMRLCQGRLGGELQRRQHQTNALLTGHYLGVTISMACEQESGAQLLGSARAGLDAAKNIDRPGGDQRQYSARIAGYMPMTSGWGGITRSGALLDVEVSHFDDAAGYSPLLDNGAVRRLQRQTVRAEYLFTVRKLWQWSLGVEWVRQRSSLELFRMQSHGPYVALRAQW